jgi:ubiquinone biosynthesis protein COQ9
LKTTAKIKQLVLQRLEMTKPVIHYWPQALRLMALPQNAPTTVQQLGQLVDEMWFLAGDTSTDLNWYSKRILLAGVYTSTGIAQTNLELFMTTDPSEGYKNTEMFLDRRLRDVGTAGRTFSNISQLLQFQTSQVCSIVKSRMK